LSRRCTLSLKGLELRVRLGALPVEKLSPRSVSLDLEWRGRTDPSAPAVDYASVCDQLGQLASREYSWIEELASAALDLLSERWSGSWEVTVTKTFPPAPVPLESATCTMEGEDA
jgi:dihydroneopterin aldolase